MPINATGPALNTTGSRGDVRPGAGRVKSFREIGNVDVSRLTANVADNFVNLQFQIDQINAALAQQQSIQSFAVTNAVGQLIAWIGDTLVSGIQYMGAWFKQLYIGGSSAATAKIVADASGNVSINGATITINSGGTLTTINNAVNPWSTNAASLTSTHIATGEYSMVDPFNFAILNAANLPLVRLSNGGGGLGYVFTNGGVAVGSSGQAHLYPTELAITNGTTRTMTLDNSTSIFSLNGPLGNTFVADDGVDTSDVVTPKLNGGTIPTSGPLAANGSQQLVSATAGAGISLGATSITNTGVLSNIAGTGISVSGATGNVTIGNTGVTSLTSGTGISVSGATGGVTVTNTAPFPGGGASGSFDPTAITNVDVVNGLITGWS